MNPQQAKQTEEVLKAKTAKSKDHGIEHEFVMYDGAHHGFAVRVCSAGKKAPMKFNNPPD
jgi:dienelactone hydrolase